MDPAIELDHKRHADELRDSWQARVLADTDRTSLGKVVLSVLAHSFDEAMPVLLRVVFPGFVSIRAPFMCSAGKIDKWGRVVGDVVTPDGAIIRNHPLFQNTRDLERAFRNLADRLKLSDDDRRGLFAALGAWLVADMRLDPAMDPRDPDAKRLAIH